MKKVGSRAEVMHGSAERTGYGKKGLKRGDLMYSKSSGKIVSRRMSRRAKRDKRLIRAGWKTKKGVFGAFHVSGKKRGTRRRRRTRRKGRRKGRRKRRRSRRGCRNSRGRYRKC